MGVFDVLFCFVFPQNVYGSKPLDNFLACQKTFSVFSVTDKLFLWQLFPPDFYIGLLMRTNCLQYFKDMGYVWEICDVFLWLLTLNTTNTKYFRVMVPYKDCTGKSSPTLSCFVYVWQVIVTQSQEMFVA